MKSLPSISSQIDEKIINKVIQKKFALLSSYFFYFMSNWLIRAYKRYNDVDKFLIIIYLIHKNLIFYRKNALIIDYESFYKERTLEIEKINISDISHDLKIPKESVRRKVLDLEKKGSIKKIGKKIFVDKSTFVNAKATDTLKDLSILLNEFNKLLKEEKITDSVFQLDEIINSIKENFSFCLYQLNKFIFVYLNRWREEVKDLETLTVAILVVLNATENKNFKPSKLSIKSYREEIMGSDTKGVNAMSISDITGIPRPTVVRKLKWLIDKKFLIINDKKLISLDAKGSAFKKSKNLQDKNMLSLSNFIYRLFNQIKVISS
ncbi:MarR family transcriptional regulator [Candidatus Pelagibacter bacterium]|nr:MarR family transcriptional regulator [Candidatus Pelagibacter bacterium]MDA9232601.1 MarR family transcriptional regulator [Candidatus Pelagibacter sp.]